MSGDAPSFDAGPRAGPVPGLWGAIASWAYAREIARRNRAYDRGKNVRALDVPVISVGNLSVGGTGKTPTVSWVVEALRAAGRRPCIAMRGYKAAGRGVHRRSDEAMEYAERFGPKVPVCVNPDRFGAVRELLASPEGRGVDSVVLDDGFQHRRLARTRDLVLVDATRDPFEDELLPAGWLREPVGSLTRATAVLITHAESATPERVESLSSGVRGVTGRDPLAVVRHVWSGFRVLENGRERTAPLAWLSTRAVLATCAIGNPGPFLKETRKRSGRFVGEFTRRDHDPYAPATARALTARASSAGADTILCTGKDLTKLRGSVAGDAEGGLTRWDGALACPILILVFDHGEEALRRHVLSAFTG